MELRSMDIRFIRLMFACVFFSALVSCGSEEDLVIPIEPSYSSPDDKLTEFKNLFNGSDNGWNAVLKPKTGKMYRVFFTLSNDEVSMYSDADTVSAKTATHTKYSFGITQSVNASINFEEGSNLDKISLPGRSEGVDKTYSFKFSNQDTLYLTGNQFGDELLLFKATSGERVAYEAGELKKRITEINDYLSDYNFLYFNLEPGKLLQLRFTYRSVLTIHVNNGANVLGSDFVYSLDGISLKNPVKLETDNVQELFWDNLNKRIFINYNGTRIEAQTSEMPVVPLHYMLGNEFPYMLLMIDPYLGELPGWAETFKGIWITEAITMFSKSGYELYYIGLDLILTDNTMNLNVYVNSGNQIYLAQFPYKFSKTQAGVYTFTPLPINTSTQAGQLAEEIEDMMPKLLSVFNENDFTMEFYNGGEDFGLMAKLQSTTNNDIYFTTIFYN